MRKQKYYIIIMLFAAIFAFFPTVEIGATAAQRERLQELRRDRDQARSELNQTEELLRGLRSDIDDLLAVMEYYAQRMTNALDDLEEIEIVILETTVSLAYTEYELIEARENRDQQEELFRARLRAMHEQGPVGYLAVLFQATSFADFLVSLEHVRAVAQFDQEVLADMEAAEERVANSLGNLARLGNLFDDLHVQQQAAIVALEEAVEAHEAMLVALSEDEETLDLLVELERATLRELEAEFGLVESAIRAHEAEEARQRRLEQQRARQAEQDARLAHLNDPSRTFLWPLPARSHVSSGFGQRVIFGRSQHHTGIDIPAPAGSRIIAAADGYVRLAGWNGGFGISVIIDHGNGYSTLYAHNSRNRVSVGQRVNRGDHIADVGTTGISTGNHLHFEIRRNGTPVDPMQYFR